MDQSVFFLLLQPNILFNMSCYLNSDQKWRNEVISANFPPSPILIVDHNPPSPPLCMVHLICIKIMGGLASSLHQV